MRQLAAVQTVVYNLNIDVSVQRLDLNARDLKRKYPYRVARFFPAPENRIFVPAGAGQAIALILSGAGRQ